MKKNGSLVVGKLSDLVAEIDIHEAERLLVNIANEKGDQEVAVILQQLPTADVLAIVREGDMSNSSILHSFITPKQFGEMICLESQHGVAKSIATSKATGMISAIIFGDNIDPEVTPVDFIRAMFTTEAGTKELMKFLLLGSGGGDANDENIRFDQILHFMQFGNFDFRTEEPENQEDADLQESNEFCFFSGAFDGQTEHHDLSWRHVVSIIVTEMDEEKELLLHALRDYQNTFTAPKASIPDNKMVPVASGKEVESAL